MSRSFVWALLASVLFVLVGCKEEYLTPEEVRSQLEDPTGTVDDSSLPTLADDWFGAGDAFAAEDMAGSIKSSQSRRAKRGRPLDVLLAPEVLDSALSYGAASTVVDIFCVTDLVMDISEYDDCERGDTCEVELTIDSCILRLGDNGDELASGSITFTLTETTTAEYDRGELKITFDAWEYTDGGYVDHTDGILALEVTEYKDVDRDEVIYSVDLVRKIIDPDEDGVFSDGATWEGRARAAMRITTLVTGITESATLEILCWVDEGDDGTHEDSLVILLDYTSTQLTEQVQTSTVTLQVKGTNGNFTCTWTSAVNDRSESVTTYHSEGECVDDDTGETFSWNGTHTVTES